MPVRRYTTLLHSGVYWPPTGVPMDHEPWSATWTTRVFYTRRTFHPAAWLFKHPPGVISREPSASDPGLCRAKVM